MRDVRREGAAGKGRINRGRGGGGDRGGGGVEVSCRGETK